MVRGFRSGIRGERGTQRELSTRLLIAVGSILVVLAFLFWSAR